MNQKLKKHIIKSMAVLFSAATLFTVAASQNFYAAKPSESNKISAQQQDLNNRLLTYAKNGKLEELNSLLNNPDVDVNARDNENNTALMLAVRNNQAKIVNALIEKGAVVDDINSVLMWAAFCGHTETVITLLNKGADVNAKNKRGQPALMCAALYGHTDVVNHLLNHGADVNAKANFDDTALMCAAQEGYTDIVNLLIGHGADVNAKGRYGRTALMWAAFCGHTDIVNLLLNHSADFNAKDLCENTALMLAALYGHQEIVNLLIDHNADVNLQNNNGETALRMAVKSGHTDIVEALLDTRRINHSLRDFNGITDCQFAMSVDSESFRIIRMFLDHGAKPLSSKANIRDIKAIVLLSAMRNTNLFEYVFKYPIRLTDCNFKDSEYGRTPLMWAAINGSNENFCYFLLNFFGCINVNEQDIDGKTVFMHAIKNNHPKFVNYLWHYLTQNSFENFSDIITIKDHNDKDVNDYAKEKGYKNFFDWLINFKE